MDPTGFSFPYFHQLWEPSSLLTGASWEPDTRLNDDTKRALKKAIRMLAVKHLAVPQVGETFESLDSLLERFWTFGFSQGLPFTLFDLILGVHCAQRWTTNCPAQYTFSYTTNGDGTVTYMLASSNHTHNHQPFANPFQMPQTYRPRVLTGHFDCFGNITEPCAKSTETDLTSTPKEHYAEFTETMHDFSATFRTMLLKLEDLIAACINRAEHLDLIIQQSDRRCRAASAPSPVHCSSDSLGYSSVAIYGAPMGTALEEVAEDPDS